MKNMQDINTRLWGELEQWYIKQCRNEYEEYHLYYLPTTAEHDGGISICSEPPPNPEMKLADPHKINGYHTIDQNFTRLQSVCRRLPILEL